MSLFACTINPAVTVVTDYLCVADAANAARAASSSAASVLLGLLDDSESASESEVSAGMYHRFGPGSIVFFHFGFGGACVTVGSGGAKVDADVDGTGS